MGLPNVTPEEDEAWEALYPSMCSVCGDYACVVVELSHGCVAFKSARRQALCLQHLTSIQPLGTITKVGYWAGNPAAV